MKAHQTPWWYYVIAGILGLLAGLLLGKITENSAYALMGAPIVVSVLLICLGLLVLLLAWQVHQYAKGNLKTMDMSRAVQTLLLSKALGVAGAALAGWYGGQLIIGLMHLEADFYHDAVIECAIAMLICVADMIVGIIGEYWCQLPPKQGPEHPQVKENERVRKLAAASTPVSTAEPNANKRRDSRENSDTRFGVSQ